MLGDDNIIDSKNYQLIVNSEKFKIEKKFRQHGFTSVYDHSINVCKTCLSLSNRLHLNVDEESLIKGSLLHDYFLYDWHDNDPSHRLHGIRHPRFARDNALRDFGLNEKEENMILSHMFPLGYVLPKSKESIILCICDKYCACQETFDFMEIFRKTYNIYESFRPVIAFFLIFICFL